MTETGADLLAEWVATLNGTQLVRLIKWLKMVAWNQLQQESVADWVARPIVEGEDDAT